jgi:hypothetical protein
MSEALGKVKKAFSSHSFQVNLKKLTSLKDQREYIKRNIEYFPWSKFRKYVSEKKFDLNWIRIDFRESPEKTKRLVLADGTDIFEVLNLDSVGMNFFMDVIISVIRDKWRYDSYPGVKSSLIIDDEKLFNNFIDILFHFFDFLNNRNYEEWIRTKTYKNHHIGEGIYTFEYDYLEEIPFRREQLKVILDKLMVMEDATTKKFDLIALLTFDHLDRIDIVDFEKALSVLEENCPSYFVETKFKEVKKPISPEILEKYKERFPLTNILLYSKDIPYVIIAKGWNHVRGTAKDLLSKVTENLVTGSFHRLTNEFLYYNRFEFDWDKAAHEMIKKGFTFSNYITNECVAFIPSKYFLIEENTSLEFKQKYNLLNNFKASGK